MQQAIPYRSWQPLISSSPTTTHFTSSINNTNNTSFVSTKMVSNMVLENAVIVFARRGCCMSHVVKRLLLGLGVNPAMHEVEEKDEVAVIRELEAIVGSNENSMQFPAVFIGGKLFGGLDRLMATHISGELVPILKEARALWL
ncbi:glutaredoxin-C9-like [Vigna unguiculata]|uniref:Glutaredoxin 3 n=1 Tax=Vigna unguiculata TaxID=3917 RepID=A0A4D6LH77_VIGUN|nr:glutaredoxin-C9-like [Vigna unguiculata]QCD87675.1 glutaredoxin 3 [Vigna unguiculata]QCD92241.1 glutaredoxin 3 [Vigna unguiculata]